MAYQQAAPLPSLSSLFDLSDRVLTAEQGSYALTGQAAGLTASAPGGGQASPFPFLESLFEAYTGAYTLSAGYGTYALTGQDATLARGLLFAADSGSYSYTGQVALFSYVQLGQGGDPAPLPHIGLLLRRNTYTLTADPGAYSINGSDAYVDYEASGEQGSYEITGQDANLLATRILVAEAGSYAITGQDAGMDIGSPARTLTADTTTYAVTGNDAGLYVRYRLNAEQGFYALLGQQADFSFGYIPQNYVLTASVGVYQIEGFEITSPYVPVRRSRGGHVIRPKRYVVKIDDEEFIVSSIAEARKLIATAEEAAKEKAEKVSERIKPLSGKAKRRAVQEARKDLQPPSIDIEGAAEIASEAEARIAAIYDAVIRAAKRRQEEDDEEILLLL